MNSLECSGPVRHAEHETKRSHHQRTGGGQLDSRRHDDLNRRLPQFEPSDGRHPHDHSQRREEPHGDRRSLRRPRNGFVDRRGLREDRNRTDDFRREPRADRADVSLRRAARRAGSGRTRRAYVLPGSARRCRAAAVAAVARRRRHRLRQGQHAAQGIRRPDHRRVAAGDPRPAHRRSLDSRRSRRSLRQCSACRHRVRRPLASPSSRQDHRDSGQGHPERRGPRQPVSHLDRQRGCSGAGAVRLPSLRQSGPLPGGCHPHPRVCERRHRRIEGRQPRSARGLPAHVHVRAREPRRNISTRIGFERILSLYEV